MKFNKSLYYDIKDAIDPDSLCISVAIFNSLIAHQVEPDGTIKLMNLNDAIGSAIAAYLVASDIKPDA